jgi:hypothetical protein
MVGVKMNDTQLELSWAWTATRQAKESRSILKSGGETIIDFEQSVLKD